jgi:hypothetical protein
MVKMIKWLVVLVLAMALVWSAKWRHLACEKAVEGMVGGTLFGVAKVCRYVKVRNETLLNVRRLKNRVIRYGMEGLGGGILVGMLAISITFFLH